MLHVVLHVMLHVRCMSGVWDRAVTLSKWCACHAERRASATHDIAESGQKGVKTVAVCISRSTIHIGTYAHVQANRTPHTHTHKHTHTHTNTRTHNTHTNTHKHTQTHTHNTHTHKHPPKLIPMLSLTQCRHHSCVCLPWVNPIVSFLSPGSSKKQPSHEVPHHGGHVPPVPQSNVVF